MKEFNEINELENRIRLLIKEFKRAKELAHRDGSDVKTSDKLERIETKLLSMINLIDQSIDKDAS